MYSIDQGVAYVELANISASLQTSLEIQIKDLPKEEKEYWRNYHRFTELGVILRIVKVEKTNPDSIRGYDKLKAEYDELESKLVEYVKKQKEIN